VGDVASWAQIGSAEAPESIAIVSPNAQGGTHRELHTADVYLSGQVENHLGAGVGEQSDEVRADDVGLSEFETTVLLCRGECFNPTEGRRIITHIDVVRVRPQVRPGEPVRPLIDDPWRRFECPKSEAGCVVEFEDPDYATSGRENIYYVRAVQEPTLAINANPLRCDYDDKGTCVKVHPCYGDYRTPLDDDCLAPAAERAWSSPIYLQPAGG